MKLNTRTSVSKHILLFTFFLISKNPQWLKDRNKFHWKNLQWFYLAGIHIRLFIILHASIQSQVQPRILWLNLASTPTSKSFRNSAYNKNLIHKLYIIKIIDVVVILYFDSFDRSYTFLTSKFVNLALCLDVFIWLLTDTRIGL